ncbi:MAG: YfcE family phosphodiesterase [Pseudomonadota bacterium]|nr:YfcE family phosphodiesterase [Pseudomonadota bacterium]
MSVGVVSDTHNRVTNVEKIIDIFNDMEVDTVLHTGDITQAKTLSLFTRLNCPLIGVYGNNDLKEPNLRETARLKGFEFEKPPLVKRLEGKNVAIFHEPDDISNFLKNNSTTDLVVHGHTHKFRDEEIEGTRVFNPGECAGMIKGKNAVGIIDLKNFKIKRIFF